MSEKCNKDMTIQNELLAKIEIVIKTMNEIDDIIDRTSDEQSKIDSLRSDYLHLYENYDLTDESMVKISKKLHDCCIVRRNWNNVFAIGKVYRENVGKLIFKGQREFAYNSIKHVANNLDNDYKNRVMTDEEQQELLTNEVEVETPKRKKHLTKDVKKEILDKIKKGFDFKTLAIEYGVCRNTIDNINKRSEDYE